MKLAISSDHAGFSLKAHLVQFLLEQGHEVDDLGVDAETPSTDYPEAARNVARAIRQNTAERGICVCGSGVGVAIAANKFAGVYACLCHDTYTAHQGVEHDRMNVLCLGAKVIGTSLAEEIVLSFINAQPMDVDRYERRFQMVKDFEQHHDPK